MVEETSKKYEYQIIKINSEFESKINYENINKEKMQHQLK